MMRVAALFALLAVAAAGKKRSKHFVFPDASQYIVEGQELVQPGGTFEVLGQVIEGWPLEESDTAYEYCPIDALPLGTSKFHVQPLSMEVKWSVSTMVIGEDDEVTIENFSGSSVFEEEQVFGIQSESDFAPPGIINFVMTANGYEYRVKINTDMSNEIVFTLLNRENGLPNCVGTFPLDLSDDNVFEVTIGPICSEENCPVAISDFSISQTAQGGFYLSSALYSLTTGATDEVIADSLSTVPFGNAGVACKFRTISNGDNIIDGADFDDAVAGPTEWKPKRPKRKNYISPQGDDRCPSFAANANEFGGGNGNPRPEFNSTFYAFKGKVPRYNWQGEREHAGYNVVVYQANAETDIWFVSLWADEVVDGNNAPDFRVLGDPEFTYIVKRTSGVESKLSAQKLKSKEFRRERLPFKQANRAAGYFVQNSGNSKKNNKFAASSFQNNHAAEKPRSRKKGTKTEQTNKQNRKRKWKNRARKNQKGGV